MRKIKAKPQKSSRGYWKVQEGKGLVPNYYFVGTHHYYYWNKRTKKWEIPTAYEPVCSWEEYMMDCHECTPIPPLEIVVVLGQLFGKKK